MSGYYRFLAFAAFAIGVGVNDAGAETARWTSWSGASGGTGFGASGVELAESGPASARLKARTPGCYYTRRAFTDGRMHDVIVAPGASQFPAGHPDLPALAQWVVVPAGARIQMEIAPGLPVYAGQLDIAPVQPPRTDSSYTAPPFTKDVATYARNADYPGVFAETGVLFHIRGQPMNLVRLYPYQYNPVSRRLTVYPDLQVRVRFDGSGRSVPTRLRSSSFDGLLRRAAPNADAVLSLPPTVLATFGGSYGGTNGCEYLIICAPNFTNAACRLADWRMKCGVATRVVDTGETGDTTDSIRSYITNAYATWNPAPSYVLLMADTDDIPVWYATNGTPTDLFYVDMDEPTDYMADIAGGRLPIATAQQAENYVSRVIEYETVRLPAAYYTTTVHAAAFQDGEDEPTPDTYEDRRFAKTSEDMFQYFGTHGFSPQRIYTTYNAGGGSHASVTPSNWATFVEFVFENDGAGGLPLPSYLRKPGFPWDGSRSNITEAFNAGAFLITHRDHADGGGWSSPPFSSADVDALTNGNLRPIVFSINCLSGMFNSPFSDLFCERLLRHPTGGAIGCIGSTAISLSGRNDRMCWGWMDAIWPDFIEYFGGTNAGTGPLHRMGDVLPYGKLYMMEHFIFNDDTRLSLSEFHWLGDPLLEIWTGVPGDLVVSHPPEVVMNETSLTVNVDQANARVCCTFGDRILGMAVSAGGQAVVSFSNALPGVGSLFVTVTKHNFLPYQGTVVVTRTGLDHYVSTNGADSYPYTSWATAARVLQDAIDASENGDYVYVSNGVYNLGGRVQPGFALTNRVMIDKPVCLVGMNAPTGAIIRGKGISFGLASVRPAYLAQGARIEGVTLSGGFTFSYNQGDGIYDQSGGGIFIDGDAVVSNCVVLGNTAMQGGGGIICCRGGTVLNSTMISNQAYWGMGGGVYMYASNSQAPRVEYCTISSNQAQDLGGGILVRGNGSVRHSLISQNWGDTEGAGVTLYGFFGGVQTAENCRIIGNYCNSSGRRGAGIHLRQGGVAINCLIAGNRCDHGAGVFCFAGGTLYNCTIAGNLANTNAYFSAGGVMCYNGGDLRNCIIVSNRASSCPNWTNIGSGMSYRYTCTVPTNGLPGSSGCIEADPRFVDGPAGNYRLAPDSPCINAGSNAYAHGETDIDGHSRILRGVVDMGAYECEVGALRPHLAITNEPSGPVAFNTDTYVLRGTCDVHVAGSVRVFNEANDEESFFPAAATWEAPAVSLEYGTNEISVSGSNYVGQTDTDEVTIYRQTAEEVAPLVTITSAPACIPIEETTALIAGTCANLAGQLSWTDDSEPGTPHAFDPGAGTWSVTVTGLEAGVNLFTVAGTNQYGHATNASVTISRMPMVTYVSPSGGDEYPYESWAKAAHAIQPAVEAVGDGGTVWVTNGVYASGSATGVDLSVSRVLLDRPLAVRSVNGPAHSFIEGAVDPATGGNGTNAIRCAYLANGALLAGFTITNGHTRDDGGTERRSGGGVYAADLGTVSNCVIVGNGAQYSGGGVYCCSGVVADCVVAWNRADAMGGGIGTRFGWIRRCQIVDNLATNPAPGLGGGVYLGSGIMENCLVARNRAAERGGGVAAVPWSGTPGIRNCTIVDNVAADAGGVYLDKSEIVNSIIWSNTAGGASNNVGGYSSDGAYCCTTPGNYMPPDGPWFTHDPCFVDAGAENHRLATNSPCVDAGSNVAGVAEEADLDGNPRLINGMVDLGAYEIFSTLADSDTDGMPDWWEWAYGHSVTNMAPDADADSDGANNLDEYLAGMDPIDPESVFRVTDAWTPGGAAVNVITWSSASNLWYTLEASTNLLIGFDWPVASHLPATPPLNVHTDTAPPTVMHFYRVIVE